MATERDWYERRNELFPGQIFRTYDGDVVLLDCTVPGDGTRWQVADLVDGNWAFYGNTVEPGDLRGEPMDGADLANVGAQS